MKNWHITIYFSIKLRTKSYEDVRFARCNKINFVGYKELYIMLAFWGIFVALIVDSEKLIKNLKIIIRQIQIVIYKFKKKKKLIEQDLNTDLIV